MTVNTPESERRARLLKQLTRRGLPFVLFILAIVLIGVDQAAANDDPVYDQYSLQATAIEHGPVA